MMDKLKQTDILQILTLIRANYENAYANKGDEEAELLVKFWFESLNKYPRSAVLEGTKNAIRNCEYPPRLANIIDEIKKLITSNDPSDEELWAQLNGVLGRVYRTSRYLQYPQHYQWAKDKIQEIYNGLNENLKLYVVNPSSLVEISELEPEVLAFEKARFYKHMPVLRKNNSDKKAAEEFLKLCNSSEKQALPQTTDKKNNK
jgi:hypothetical protein